MTIGRKVGFLEWLALVVVSVSFMFWPAFVAFKLWGWLIVPMGIQAVPVKSFVGVGLLLGLFTYKVAPEGTPEESINHQWNKLYTGVLYTSLALLLGWIATVVL